MPLLVVRHRSGDLFVACLWEQQSRREATEMNFKACFLVFFWVGGWVGYMETDVHEFVIICCYHSMIILFRFFLTLCWSTRCIFLVSDQFQGYCFSNAMAGAVERRPLRFGQTWQLWSAWNSMTVAIGRWVRVEVSDRYDGTHVFFMCFQTHSLHSGTEPNISWQNASWKMLKQVPSLGWFCKELWFFLVVRFSPGFSWRRLSKLVNQKGWSGSHTHMYIKKSLRYDTWVGRWRWQITNV